MKINHPLMHNNFSSSDMDSVRKLLKNKDLILTQSKKVLEFEISTRHQVSINTSKTTNFSLFYLGIETHEGLLHEKLIFH